MSDFLQFGSALTLEKVVEVNYGHVPEFKIVYSDEEEFFFSTLSEKVENLEEIKEIEESKEMLPLEPARKKEGPFEISELFDEAFKDSLLQGEDRME